MPRYSFHVVDGEFIPHPGGIECSDEGRVKHEAVRIVGEMLKDRGLDILNTKHLDMFVCDDKNQTRFKLSHSARPYGGSRSAERED